MRELENAIERAVVLGESDTLLVEDLPETVLDAPAPQPRGALQASVTDVKRQLILRAWEQGGGDYKLAAAKLNIHPNSLIRLIRIPGLTRYFDVSRRVARRSLVGPTDLDCLLPHCAQPAAAMTKGKS